MKHFIPSKATLLSLAGAALLFSACQKEGTPEADPGNEPKTRPLTAQEVQTLSSTNDFGYRTFAALRTGAGSSNLFISPLSISAALTMTYNGADGTTKDAMRQTLGFTGQTDAAINQSFKSLFELLTTIDRTVEFAAANSIWHGQQYTLQVPFAQTNQLHFDATLRAVNFSDVSTKNAINQWVSDKTKARITSIVEQTSADDVMYLINAIYFKGSWARKFDKTLTRKSTFHKEDGSTASVDFMTLKNGSYSYYADATKQVIDLPYGNKQFSMTVIVPSGSATLATVSSQLTSANLDTWLAAATTSSWELRMPKFRMEYKKELSNILTQLGMGEAFTERANFSRMLQNSSQGLAISKVEHKTFLEVDEEGTEAAAVTSVGVVTTSIPPTISVDRPFLFLIREKSSNAVLFMGQLVQP
ncbi:serpin family protein [Microvirga sp. STR05]|uniref:Serpin family protein n=1 Tax=Hymenobacter duratus TaxID=2771356 RepID=A0ABR8JMJ9_9BACT|nr:serpin family protein [Hymenobacter duratus]MBD2715764.1 serpin family protein [Hymenobacter duratus]MBR7950675.1 serpin family protein [Microvirga sp. STR05]